MAQERSYRAKLLVVALMILFLLSLGTFTYHALEGWTYVDAAYFSSITMTTIGYGDITPTHDSSKIFTIFFVFASVCTFLFSIGVIGEHYFRSRVSSMERTVEMIGAQAQKAFTFRKEEDNGNTYAARRDHVRGMEIYHKSEQKHDNGFRQGVRISTSPRKEVPRR